jgi:hypothetical protein
MRRFATFCLGCVLMLLAACETPGPEIDAQTRPDADFSRYRTFAFVQPLSTDRKEYTSILSEHLMRATRAALEARGYRYAPESPDLQVDFEAEVRTHTEWLAMPRGYYGRWHGGYGWYDPWMAYDTMPVQHQEGRLAIELIDARQKAVVWEGSARGRVTSDMRRDLERNVEILVSDIFSAYPYVAGQR